MEALGLDQDTTLLAVSTCEEPRCESYAHSQCARLFNDSGHYMTPIESILTRDTAFEYQGAVRANHRGCPHRAGEGGRNNGNPWSDGGLDGWDSLLHTEVCSASIESKHSPQPHSNGLTVGNSVGAVEGAALGAGPSSITRTSERTLAGTGSETSGRYQACQSFGRATRVDDASRITHMPLVTSLVVVSIPRNVKVVGLSHKDKRTRKSLGADPAPTF
jgi:hypothetical protein